MCTSGASAQSSGADTIAGSTSQHLAGRAAADPESANVGKAKNLRQTRQPVGKKKGTAHASSLMQAGKHKLTTDSGREPVENIGTVWCMQGAARAAGYALS